MIDAPDRTQPPGRSRNRRRPPVHVQPDDRSHTDHTDGRGRKSAAIEQDHRRRAWPGWSTPPSAVSASTTAASTCVTMPSRVSDDRDADVDVVGRGHDRVDRDVAFDHRPEARPQGRDDVWCARCIARGWPAVDGRPASPSRQRRSPPRGIEGHGFGVEARDDPPQKERRRGGRVARISSLLAASAPPYAASGLVMP